MYKRQEGTDITVVANSMMTIKAEKAIRKLQKDGVSAELIDLRTIVPLDTETIVPVSYTHLDVYKRQEHRGNGNIFTQPILYG